MIKCVEGFVVSEVDFQESSKIINIFTKEYGIIGLMARGCKRLKNKLNGKCSKFTYGMFHISYKENKLSILFEVDIIDNLLNIKKDIVKIGYLTYLTDLVMQVYKQDEDNNIYTMFIDSIKKINDLYDPTIISNILEIKLLNNLGIMPVLDTCVSCGSSNIVTISSYKGGCLCRGCLNNEKIVNEKTLKLIKMFMYIDISKIDKINVSDNIKKEINEFIDDYYDRYSGIYLKTKSFLKELIK